VWERLGMTAAADDSAEKLVVVRSDGDRSVLPASWDRVRIIVDSGVIEVFTGNGSAAFR